MQFKFILVACKKNQRQTREIHLILCKLRRAARENKINFAAEMFLWLVNRHENENSPEKLWKVFFILFQNRKKEEKTVSLNSFPKQVKRDLLFNTMNVNT